jgi:hypothetical protein
MRHSRLSLPNGEAGAETQGRHRTRPAVPLDWAAKGFPEGAAETIFAEGWEWAEIMHSRCGSTPAKLAKIGEGKPLIEHVVEIVAAYVGKNRLDPEDVAGSTPDHEEAASER